MEEWIRISLKGFILLDMPLSEFHEFKWACPVIEPLHQPASFDEVIK